MTREQVIAIASEAMAKLPSWSSSRQKAGLHASPRRRWLVGRRTAWIVRTRTVGRWAEVEVDDVTGRVLRCEEFGVR